MLKATEKRIIKNMVKQSKFFYLTSFEVDYLKLSHIRDLGIFKASNYLYKDGVITFSVVTEKIEGIDNIFYKFSFNTVNDKITFLSFLNEPYINLNKKDTELLHDIRQHKTYKLSKKEEVEQYFANKLKYQLKNKNKYQSKIILKNRLNLMNKTLSLLDDKYSVEEALKQVLSEEEYYKHVEFEESKGEKDLDINTFLYGAKLISLVQKLHE